MPKREKTNKQKRKSSVEQLRLNFIFDEVAINGKSVLVCAFSKVSVHRYPRSKGQRPRVNVHSSCKFKNMLKPKHDPEAEHIVKMLEEGMRKMPEGVQVVVDSTDAYFRALLEGRKEASEDLHGRLEKMRDRFVLIRAWKLDDYEPDDIGYDCAQRAMILGVHNLKKTPEKLDVLPGYHQ